WSRLQPAITTPSDTSAVNDRRFIAILMPACRGTAPMSHPGPSGGSEWFTLLLCASARLRPISGPSARRPLEFASISEGARLNARTDSGLYRHSSKFFVTFLALLVWAFWPSYFTRLFEQPSFWFHAHGIALTLWCVLLVVQAQLI